MQLMAGVPAAVNNAPGARRDAPTQIGLLPNFCANRNVFLIVLAGELLAFVLAVNGASGLNDFWLRLALCSLFIQWVALSSALLLCALSGFSHRLGVTSSLLLAYLLTQAVTVATTVAAAWMTEPVERLVAGAAAPAPIDWPALAFPLLRNLLTSSIVWLVLLRYFYIQHRWRQNVRAESEARLQALQARIRPHFLFNSMNTIASLIYDRPAQAEQAVLDLCDLFRSNLRQRDVIALCEEIELAQRYLSLERCRLGERLRVSWRVADDVPEDLPIPPLILQPLLENAVYHGVEPSPQGGDIDIAIAVDSGFAAGQTLALDVVNTLPPSGAAATRRGGGHGIAQNNIRQRLALAFGDRAVMNVSLQRGRYRVALRLPLQASS